MNNIQDFIYQYTKTHTIWIWFDFCIKPKLLYQAQKPRMDLSNRGLYERGILMYPTLRGLDLATCSVPSARRFPSLLGHSVVEKKICEVETKILYL